MRVFHFFILFAIISTLVSFSEAVVNEPVRKKLLNIARGTEIARNNRKDFNQAAGLARRLLNDCSANVCFALDGSSSIGKFNFETQKEFVLLISSLLGGNNETRFSAVQYGAINSGISSLEEDSETFIEKVLQTEYQKAPVTFVAAGMAYCIHELGKRKNEPSKVVLFGDGGANLGRLTGPFGPAMLAERFRNRSEANSVCAVTVGYKGKPALFVDIVGGEDKKSLVIGVERWEKIISVLRALITGICERKPKF